MTYFEIPRATGNPLRHAARKVNKAEAWALLRLAAPLTFLALDALSLAGDRFAFFLGRYLN